MNLTPASSIAFLFIVLALVGSGVYLRWSKREAQALLSRPAAEPIKARVQPEFRDILTGEEAIARHLYGESVAWAPQLMAQFDEEFETNPVIRAIWLGVARDRITRSQNVQAHRA